MTLEQQNQLESSEGLSQAERQDLSLINGDEINNILDQIDPYMYNGISFTKKTGKLIDTFFNNNQLYDIQSQKFNMPYNKSDALAYVATHPSRGTFRNKISSFKENFKAIREKKIALPTKGEIRRNGNKKEEYRKLGLEVGLGFSVTGYANDLAVDKIECGCEDNNELARMRAYAVKEFILQELGDIISEDKIYIEWKVLGKNEVPQGLTYEEIPGADVHIITGIPGRSISRFKRGGEDGDFYIVDERDIEKVGDTEYLYTDGGVKAEIHKNPNGSEYIWIKSLVDKKDENGNVMTDEDGEKISEMSKEPIKYLLTRETSE